MKKKHCLVLVTVFILSIFIISVISMTDKDKLKSEKENRNLKQKPEFSFKALFNGTYAKEFEEYYSDNFPFRESLININFKIESLFKVNNDDDISLIIGGDGSNLDNNEDIFKPPVSTRPDHTFKPGVTPEPTPIPDNDVDSYNNEFLRIGDRVVELFGYTKQISQAYIDAVNTVASKLPDVNVYSLLTPTSVEFYVPDKYKSLSQSQLEAINYIYSNLKKSNIKTVNVYDTMKKHTNEYIYFRTDHHWTQRGAYYSYAEFCKTAGFKAIDIKKFETDKINGFLGSFSVWAPHEKLNSNPDYVELFYPYVEYTGKGYFTSDLSKPINIKAVRTPEEMSQTSQKYLTFINGNYPLNIFKTDVKNGRKIMLFKDSYGNAFAPFLLSHYEEVYIVDVRADKELNTDMTVFMKEHGITDVLFVNYITSASGSNIFKELLNMLPD